MLKKFLTISIIIFFSISLTTTSSLFQNHNLVQNSFSVFGHYSIQIVYAVHTDDDKDDDNGKDDEDDDDENSNINFPYESNSDFTNSPYLSGEDLLSSSSSTDDSSSEDSPLPSEVDKEKEDEDEDVPSDFEDSSATNRDRFSGLVDLSNPPPFSKFQDPIPEQPGQPLHPDLPSNPTLPPEAAEPRNPLIPPP
jgi:hypothetical protein